MDASPELLFEIPRGLEQSILLAVLLGFLVCLLLVESFGWVFVGVVVPGYLASVLIIQPPAGLAVLLDASLTYLVAKVFEQVLGRGGASSEFFGRERFFLLVLVSVFVRQQTQSWLWPLALETVDPYSELPVGFQRGFSSIGIVLVPLMANILWKLDLRRGMWHLTITTLATYALLAWWLLPETTLSYSALELSYEDTAIDFLGNAKAYIIFLSTAYIASQLNLYYGWDFNGILVPALLGLLWFHPAKLASTFGEAIVVYMVTVRLPRAPGLRSINLEGPRRLALVFSTTVILKWTIGWTLGDSVPTLKITDLYGFGYLLPSLLVIKMMQRKSIRAVMLPTMLASSLGFIVGSLAGFVLSFWDPPPTVVQTPTRVVAASASSRLLSNPEGVAALGHIYALERAETFPDHNLSVAYRHAWDAAARWIDAPDAEREAALHGAIEATNLELVGAGELEGRPAYAMFERPEGLRQGWGVALLVPGAPGPVLAVPRPVAEAPLAEAAAVLCRRMQCRAVLIAGGDVERDPLLGMSTSSFDMARGAVRNTPTLILRADAQMARKPILYVGGELPASIDLRRAWRTGVDLEWTDPPVEDAGRLPRIGGTLRFNLRDVDALLAASGPLIRETESPPPWIVRRAPRSTASLPSVPPPSSQEARYLELELITPLIEVATGRLPPAELEHLAWRARTLGLELWRIGNCGDGRPCLGIIDPLGADGTGWGSILIRWGPTREIGVEVPRPGEAFGTQQLAMQLWHQCDGRAIYIGPSGDDTEDPLAIGNIHTPLMPYHQALDRGLGDGTTRPLLLQVLGFGVDRALDTDVVIGLGRPALEERQQPLKLRWLFEQGPLHWAERPLLSDGSPKLHPLSGLGSPAVEYSLELGQADVALLWFSPEVRGRYINRSQREEESRAMALGLVYGELAELSTLAPAADDPRVQEPPAEIRAAVDEILVLASSYRRSHDIHALHRIVESARALSVGETVVAVVVGSGTITQRPVLSIDATGTGWSLRSLVVLEDAIDRRTTLMASDPALRRELGMALFRQDEVVIVSSGPLEGDAHAP